MQRVKLSNSLGVELANSFLPSLAEQKRRASSLSFCTSFLSSLPSFALSTLQVRICFVAADLFVYFLSYTHTHTLNAFYNSSCDR